MQQNLPSIGYGQTRSYRQVAELVGSPKAIRAVGTACATNPLPVVVPCHRALKAGGPPAATSAVSPRRSPETTLGRKPRGRKASPTCACLTRHQIGQGARDTGDNAAGTIEEVPRRSCRRHRRTIREITSPASGSATTSAAGAPATVAQEPATYRCQAWRPFPRCRCRSGRTQRRPCTGSPRSSARSG
ncbi:MAG TPA: MGMT family protein [Trebonia sp.]